MGVSFARRSGFFLSYLSPGGSIVTGIRRERQGRLAVSVGPALAIAVVLAQCGQWLSRVLADGKSLICHTFHVFI